MTYCNTPKFHLSGALKDEKPQYGVSRGDRIEATKHIASGVSAFAGSTVPKGAAGSVRSVGQSGVFVDWDLMRGGRVYRCGMWMSTHHLGSVRILGSACSDDATGNGHGVMREQPEYKDGNAECAVCKGLPRFHGDLCPLCCDASPRTDPHVSPTAPRVPLANQCRHIREYWESNPSAAENLQIGARSCFGAPGGAVLAGALAAEASSGSVQQIPFRIEEASAEAIAFVKEMRQQGQRNWVLHDGAICNLEDPEDTRSLSSE